MHYTKPEVNRAWPVYGLPTECGTGHFWSTWDLQMRKPGYKVKSQAELSSLNVVIACKLVRTFVTYV